MERLSLSESVAHISMECVQRQRWCDGWQVITAGREVRRYRRQIRVRPDVQDQIHADEYVEQEMTMEQPISCKELIKINFYLLKLISAY